MKTFGKIFNNSMAMVAIAAASMTASFGFTSCSDEDDFFEPAQQQSFEIQSEVEAEDSLAPTDKDFVYDCFGTSSPDQYIQGFDNGQAKPQSRAGIVDAALLVKDLALFVTNNIDNITEKPVQTAVTYTLDKVLSDEGPNLKAQLDSIEGRLANVQTALSTIESKIDKQEYARIFEGRLKNLILLRSHNTTYLNSYYKYLHAGDTVSANTVLDLWSNKDINGNNAEYSTLDFLSLTPGNYNSGEKTVTEIYDYWIFQTTPWEHMGYDKRDQLRQGDIITAFAGYTLTKAYWEKDPLVSHDGQIDQLTKAFRAFCAFYKGKESVERHNDRLVCQIKDANIVFKKSTKVRDIYNHPWFPNNTSLYNKSLAQVMYGDMGTQKITSTTALKRSLTKKEAEAIYNYYNSPAVNNLPDEYKPVKGANDKKYSFESIMKSVGFDLSGLEDGKMHVMTLNDECHKESESFFNRNYHFYYDNVVYANNVDKAFYGNWKVGTMWIDKENFTKSVATYDVLKWWHHYDSNNTQFFYTNIESRYTDMKPFPTK